MSDKKQGYFAARLEAKNGTVSVVPTGGYFSRDEIPEVEKVIDRDVKKAMADNISPMLLIPDAVLKTAVEGSRGDAALKLSYCNGGHRRSPCGKLECKKCSKARDDFFNNILVYGIDFGKSEFSKTVRHAVLSVLGGAVISVPWEDGMSQKEVRAMLDAIKMEMDRKDKGKESEKYGRDGKSGKKAG